METKKINFELARDWAGAPRGTTRVSITLKERFARASLAARREEQTRIFRVLLGLEAALSAANAIAFSRTSS
jgi:hypothetical protein